MQTLDQFWCGTEASLEHYMLALKNRADRSPQDLAQAFSTYSLTPMTPKAEEAPMPRLLSKVGDVGVITIYGPLVNDDSVWNKYDGLTGFPEIRDALVHAASDTSIKGIVLDINSGGGAVSGVSDTAELIDKIDAGIKPIHAFSDGGIMSAAYWLGSSARTLEIGKVTEAGSLGVLTVHSERSKMLANAGINVTVMRAGEFKALGNPYEALSEPAKKEIQGQLDFMYTMFINHVAVARGVSYPVADQKMGQGRVFIGSEAVDVGLADSVSSFDAVVSKVQVAIDIKKSVPQYGANSLKGPVVKTALTQQQVSALAEAGNPPAGKTAEELAAEKLVADKAIADAAAAQAVADKVVSDAAAAAQPTDLNAYLKTSLAESQATVLDLTIQLRDAKAALPTMSTDLATLRGFAEAVGNRIKIGLGGSAGGSETLTASALVAENDALRGTFEAKFKAGGVAAVSSAAFTDNERGAQADPVRSARIAATRPK